MQINNTLYYMLKDHLGSASETPSVLRTSPPNPQVKFWIRIFILTCVFGGEPIASPDGESLEGVGEQRYYPYGETRIATGSIYTDKLFTGQQEITGLGIYNYHARMYSPKLGRFLSADTIVPNVYNPQDLNRFSYTWNNPLKYTDPSGHDPYSTCGGNAACMGYVNSNPTSDFTSNWQYGGSNNNNNDDGDSGDSGETGSGNACSGPNPSMVCAQSDDYLGTYYAITNTAYPLQGSVSGDDKMMTERTGVPLMDLFLILHDIASIPGGSDWVARYITKENAYASVKYELHDGEFGVYPLVTTFTVVNLTNSPITVENFSTELYEGEVQSSFFIQPNSSGTVTIAPNPIIAYSVTIDLSGGMILNTTILP